MSVAVVMPTVPRRTTSAAEVVKRLLPQVDALIVHLNGHADVPAWARTPKVRVIRHPAGTGPIVRLSIVPTTDHVLFVDDDLAYPTDYAARSVAALTRLRAGTAVCYHAAYWPKGSPPHYAGRRIVMYSAGIPSDTIVTLMGSGTACFHRSDLLRIDRVAPPIFAREDDVWTSAACARKAIRLVRAPTIENWIRPLPAAYDDGALFRDATHDAFVRRDKAIKVAHAMGRWQLDL